MRALRWPVATLAMALPLAALASGCDTGSEISTGIGEPFRVAGGQFIQGDLPGSAPLLDAGVAGQGDAGTPPLSVLGLTFNSTLILPGQAGKAFGGDVTDDAVAVGARLAGLGTGYWVVPAGALDPSQPGAATFGMSANFDPNVPGGVHDLLLVAIGASGHGGVQYPTPLCIEPRIPDNGHSCNPTRDALPDTVFTLQWDTNFDLDLHVKTPAGVDFNPRQPYGVPIDGGPQGIVPPGLPHFDRDSLANCVPDGLNEEDLVFT